MFQETTGVPVFGDKTPFLGINVIGYRRPVSEFYRTVLLSAYPQFVGVHLTTRMDALV